MNIFSFFSGAGFLDLGFELQGNFNVVFVNEFHKAFNDVYQYARQQMGIAQPIYGHHVEDITEYTDGKHDEKLTNLIEHLTDSIDAFGAAWQYLHVRNTMKNSFKKAIAYADYLCKKKLIDETLENLNPTNGRFEIVSKEKNNSLIIEWPKAHLISSGQRDILVFIAKLMECEFQTKNNCILIIDEFFDRVSSSVFLFLVSKTM